MQLITVLLATAILSLVGALKLDLTIHFGAKDTVRIVDEGNDRRRLLLSAREGNDRYRVYWTDKRAGMYRMGNYHPDSCSSL